MEKIGFAGRGDLVDPALGHRGGVEIAARIERQCRYRNRIGPEKLHRPAILAEGIHIRGRTCPKVNRAVSPHYRTPNLFGEFAQFRALIAEPQFTTAGDDEALQLAVHEVLR